MISVIIPIYNNGKTLSAALLSLKSQTFSNFEALLVNNGSTDESADIIKDICEKDHRFNDLSVEKKLGVSGARNIGLRQAVGKYISFLDGDDTMPPNALKAMHDTAEDNKADMAVGNMLRNSPLRRYEFKVNAALSKQKKIDRHDMNFIYSFTVCNKLFRNDIIKKNGLEFEDLTHAEDGVFLFSYLQYCNNICGCDEIVYEYYRPLPYLGTSATTEIKKGMLEDLIVSFEHILVICKDETNSYIREIYVRAIKTSLIGEYYRKLWCLDDRTFLFMKKKILEYRRQITEEQWKTIIGNNKDLQLDKGIMDRSEAVKNPLFTVAVTRRVSPEHREKFIKSLYCQNSPFFRLVEESAGEKDFMCRALEECDTPYITFVDHDVLYSDNTLYSMHKNIIDNQCSFISVIMVALENGRRKELPVMKIPFSRDNLETAEYDIFDWTFANKMFVTESLKKCGSLDMKKIYLSLSHVRKRNSVIITKMSNEDLMCHGESSSPAERLEAFTIYEQNEEKESMKAKIYKAFTPLKKRVLLLCNDREPRPESMILYDSIKGDKIWFSKKDPSARKQISRETKICRVILSEGKSMYFSRIPLRKGQRMIRMIDVLGGCGSESSKVAEYIDEILADE